MYRNAGIVITGTVTAALGTIAKTTMELLLKLTRYLKKEVVLLFLYVMIVTFVH
jgi:hypothetical protein